jgi:hypothetical protein
MLPIHISFIKIELIPCLEIFLLPVSNASHIYDLILGKFCSFVFSNFWGSSKSHICCDNDKTFLPKSRDCFLSYIYVMIGT